MSDIQGNCNTESYNSQTPLDRVLPLFKSPRTIRSAKGGFSCKCPAHNDSENSLAVWEDQTDGHVGLKCYAMCTRKAICEAIGIEESDLYVKDEGGQPKHHNKPSLSLFDLAADKLIHPRDLMIMDLGITDGYKWGGCSVVRIPYYLEDGTEYTQARIRTQVTAKNGSKWEGTGDLIPYGLQRLDQARKDKYLVIVEGETDCWTLWAHRFPALGVPGAKNGQALERLDYFAGIDKVYIIQEPDDGGRYFASDIKKRLQSIGYEGQVHILNFHKLTGSKDPNDLHKQNILGFNDAFKAVLDSTKPPKPEIFRMCDLQREVLPEMKWAVEPILPEGVTILAGKPKMGKSWLAMAILVAISAGGVALGSYPVARKEVLYISREDNKRRLQNRINTFMKYELTSEDFHAVLQWPRINEGGYEQLEEWLQEHPRAGIVCIDTWAKFKPKATGAHKGIYDEDYDALSPLQELAAKYGVSILVVDHMNKKDYEDPLDMVSGSTGKTGAVDGFLLLFRKRGETDARLFVTGKDIEEEQELFLTFNPMFASWTVKGDVDDSTVTSTPERQKILDVLNMHPQGLKLKELAKRLGKNVNTTRNNLIPLRNENKVVLENNTYRLVTTSNTSKTSNTSNTSNPPSESPEDASHLLVLTSPLTSGLVTPDTLAMQPVEPIHNGNSSKVTSLTSVTSHSVENSVFEIKAPLRTPEEQAAHEQFKQREWDSTHPAAITPETSTKYPYDVLADLKRRNVKAKIVKCVYGHKDSHFNRMPHHLGGGNWEMMCEQCYGKGLRATNGRQCYED